MKRLAYVALTLYCAMVAAAWAQEPADLRAAPGTLNQLKALPTFKNVARLDELHTAAVVGKEQYRQLATVRNFRELGLDQASDAVGAELGTPTKDYLVRLDQLKNFKDGDDPATLLTDTGMVHYPVTQGNKIRSSVTLATAAGRWQVVSIGDAQRSQKRSDAQIASAKMLKKAEDSYFVVRIPAFNLEFQGTTDAAGTLQLAPILDSPEWELKTGTPVAAAAIFLKLVPAATKHNGLPR
ncbi:MAG: hypothetical protein HZC22_13555 [Rhodocyclales bacterium]|nr:hypothetical protein [Rhodocyclales bacterium]